MATYELTTARLEAYALRFDFRTAIVKAARQVLAIGEIEAVGPGEGVLKIPRYYTTVDFQRGAATGTKSPVPLGDRRYYEYSEFFGTLVIMNSVPIETDPKTEDAYITEDHVRELERLTALEDALFMEHGGLMDQFLTMHEILEIMPIEPDERSVDDRELNVAFRRWRLRVAIRMDGWPTV